MNEKKIFFFAAAFHSNGSHFYLNRSRCCASGHSCLLSMHFAHEKNMQRKAKKELSSGEIETKGKRLTMHSSNPHIMLPPTLPIYTQYAPLHVMNYADAIDECVGNEFNERYIPHGTECAHTPHRKKT